MPRTKKTETVNEETPKTLYLHNATGRAVEINGKVVEPDDAVSVPVEMEEEARAKGFA